MSKALSQERAFEILGKIPDPEIPVISIVELGIVRSVNQLAHGDWEICITPTYSGCPAMQMIEDQILQELTQAGFENVGIKTIYSPPWTTDWIADAAKAKLKAYGMAPPHKADNALVQLKKKPEKLTCPFCDSANTKITSEFGSTACKALYYCNDCQQPFEYFKAI